MGRALVICALLSALAPLGAAAAPLDRPADPVVLTGATVPTLLGVAPGDVVAFRWTDTWEQVPVQVDERALVDLNAPYGPYTCTMLCPPSLPPAGTLVPQYTDPGTHTGGDPDPTLDAGDEIAFMAKDTGDRPATFVEPAGVVPGTGVEVLVHDPRDGGDGFVYLFRHAGALDPGAGRSYVTYDFHLLSGPYLTTYRTGGGGNPENSTVTSPAYTRHFSERWTSDGLAVTVDAATGVDILDLDWAGIEPWACYRSPSTFDLGEGCFVANKSGPVRAIRSYMGANSGPHVQREHVFYERREDVRTALRVHSLPAVSFFSDYSAAAAGMVYRDEFNPGGVTVDGVPDAVNQGPFTWQTLDGLQGGLTHVTQLETDIPGLAYTLYYRDDLNGVGSGCSSDTFNYGSSGFWVNGFVPSTDVAAGGTNHLILTRVTYFDAPGQTDGPGRRDGLLTPLTVSVAPLGGSGAGALAGKKLLLGTASDPTRKKLLVKSADPAVAMAGVPAVDGATLRVSGTGFDDTYELAPARWTPLSGGAGWRYDDPKLTAGPIKAVILKTGKQLKVVGKGAGLGHALADDPQAVDVTLTSGSGRLCLRFGGTTAFVAGRRFTAKAAPAPAACP